MRVSTLSLRNYRNYAEADIELGPGCTMLCGANGQGKTNLVESLYFLSSLSSHRTSQNAALIRRGDEQAIIRTVLSANDRRISLELEINRDAPNRAQVNGNTARLKDFPNYLSVVLFSPEQLQLLHGEPGGRRNYLDDLCAHLLPRMAGTLGDYDRVVKQRNTLLKSIGMQAHRSTDWSTLDVWNDKFVQLAREITQMRHTVVAQIEPLLRDAYFGLAAKEHRPRIAMNYEAVELSFAGQESAVSEAFNPEEYEVSLRSFLDSHRVKECERGVTLAGPHRDDVFFGLNELPAKGSASHGETWSYMIALNLAAARIIREKSSLGDPILILDDVFSALDVDRRLKLSELVSQFEQSVVTCAVQADVPSDLATRVVSVNAGTLGQS